MFSIRLVRAGLLLMLPMVLACSPSDPSGAMLLAIPMDSIDDVLTTSDVEVDREIHSDGRASLRIDARRSTTVRIAELEDLSLDEARLVYRAKLRAKGLRGKAYLEMWCAFPGQGEFFSRALHAPISGTTQWVSQETPFFLKSGQKPSRVKLNLVIEGKGTVWIDQVELARADP